MNPKKVKPIPVLPARIEAALPTGIVTSEAVRPHLHKYARAVGPSGEVNMGPSANQVMYQLVGLKLAIDNELAVAVPMSADRMRRSWPDVRALARTLKIPFVIQIDGKDSALFRRHPDYADDFVKDWLLTFVQRGGHLGVLQPSAMQTRLTKIEEIVGGHEIRLKRLEELRRSLDS